MNLIKITFLTWHPFPMPGNLGIAYPHPTSLCGMPRKDVGWGPYHAKHTNYDTKPVVHLISLSVAKKAVTTAVGLEVFACAGIPEILEGCSIACLSCCHTLTQSFNIILLET